MELNFNLLGTDLLVAALDAPTSAKPDAPIPAPVSADTTAKDGENELRSDDRNAD